MLVQKKQQEKFINITKGLKMNKAQLNFVMDKLSFQGERRDAVQAIIIRSISAYSAENMYNIPKGTANRDAIKCAETWGKLLEDAQGVNDLLVKT